MEKLIQKEHKGARIDGWF